MPLPRYFFHSFYHDDDHHHQHFSTSLKKSKHKYTHRDERGDERPLCTLFILNVHYIHRRYEKCEAKKQNFRLYYVNDDKREDDDDDYDVNHLMNLISISSRANNEGKYFRESELMFHLPITAIATAASSSSISGSRSDRYAKRKLRAPVDCVSFWKPYKESVVWPFQNQMPIALGLQAQLMRRNSRVALRVIGEDELIR
jgi:hypothetical protein